MIIRSEAVAKLKYQYEAMAACLSEKGRRIWAATEAQALGRGGIAIVCEATGISNTTVHKGIKEIQDSSISVGRRVRQPGGGRKRTVQAQRGIRKALKKLVDPLTSGDPQSHLRWTSKSTRNLADTLHTQGYDVCHTTVGAYLKELGYSLQVNKKAIESASHKDRDAQFCYINESITKLQNHMQPTISVDTKKKENIGNYKNNGKEFSKKGRPVRVNTHDFPNKRLGKVVPYGVYDIGKNEGWVTVGISSDTAEFAVNTIKAWWCLIGQEKYPGATELLITADCGGSNGYRVKLWKAQLQKFADESKLKIHVRHFPPGTSKWNKIEHKLFSYISKNWRGQPLLTREIVVSLIGNTSTKTGLRVRAVLDENEYKLKKKVSAIEFAALNISGDAFHPEWNYTITPRENVTQVPH